VTGLDRRLGFTVGARLEDNQRYGSFATYRAGGAFHLAARTRLLASLGTSFKEPSLYQNYATGFVTGNPSLQPERSTSWEAGIDQALGAVAARVTYFNQKFHNQIDYLANASPNYQNARGSWARGVDLTVRTPLGGWGSLSAGYTYLQTRVTEGDTGATALFRTGLPLIRRPAHSATAALTTAIPGGGSAGLATTYAGSREDIDFNNGGRVTLPAYTNVDLSAEYPLGALGSGWSRVVLDLRVTNVFAAHYQEVLSFPALGRAIFVGGSWTVGSH